MPKPTSIESLVNSSNEVPVAFSSALPAGTNNIGDVDVITQPALVATTDTVTAKLATDKIQDGTTALTPKFAKANIAASSTDSSVVAAVASKKIRVLAAFVVAGATATNVTFNSASTAKSALIATGANSGIALSFNPVGWFETVAGEALTVTTGTGSTVGVQVVYVEV